MISRAKALQYYKREDVQRQILASAQDREVGIRYGDSFGKRPDMLLHARDVWEAVKQGATSFHISEERWADPLALEPGMNPRELDELRTGWDLVIDIDCPYWEYARLITHLVIEVLREHGVKSVSCKFSGNKGFHIGVPFEAFPESFSAQATPAAQLFPDGTRRVLSYIISRVSEKFSRRVPLDALQRATGKPLSELVSYVCASCGGRFKKKDLQKKTTELVCACGYHAPADGASSYAKCPKCSRWLTRTQGRASQRCPNPDCRSADFSGVPEFDPSAILNVDTVMISSRHMFRAPYSLHEKSGLVSLPIPLESVLSFGKTSAEPSALPPQLAPFLPRTAGKNEAARLFEAAFDFTMARERRQEQGAKKRAFVPLEGALPETCFPPCIMAILKGLKDGKKRALFILINFLSSSGWDFDAIEQRLEEWNKLNSPPIRAGTIRSALRSHKAQGKRILPPNCNNKPYYVEIGVCRPDALCRRIRNPANYAILRARLLQNNGKKKKKTR